MNLPLILVTVLGVMVALSLSISNTYGLTTDKTTTVNTTTVDVTDFSIDIPDNWAYEQGLFSQVGSTPSEFVTLFINKTKPLNEKMKYEGAYSTFEQDWLYGIKNAALDVYVKYKIDKQNKINVTSKQNVTIDNEPAVKVYADGIDSFSGIKFVEYMIWHDKKPYYIGYMANVKDYQKYLPQFEEIMKTFKFAK